MALDSDQPKAIAHETYAAALVSARAPQVVFLVRDGHHSGLPLPLFLRLLRDHGGRLPVLRAADHAHPEDLLRRLHPGERACAHLREDLDLGVGVDRGIGGPCGAGEVIPDDPDGGSQGLVPDLDRADRGIIDRLGR
jgi:hypothetical protein